jgi:hypothetical protein
MSSQLIQEITDLRRELAAMTAENWRLMEFIDTTFRFEDCMDHHNDDPKCQADMREIYDEAKSKYIAALSHPSIPSNQKGE